MWFKAGLFVNFLSLTVRYFTLVRRPDKKKQRKPAVFSPYIVKYDKKKTREDVIENQVRWQAEKKKEILIKKEEKNQNTVLQIRPLSMEFLCLLVY